jgi:hypothetical protein
MTINTAITTHKFNDTNVTFCWSIVMLLERRPIL